jgi:hypothetical protein
MADIVDGIFHTQTSKPSQPRARPCEPHASLHLLHVYVQVLPVMLASFFFSRVLTTDFDMARPQLRLVEPLAHISWTGPNADVKVRFLRLALEQTGPAWHHPSIVSYCWYEPCTPPADVEFLPLAMEFPIRKPIAAEGLNLLPIDVFGGYEAYLHRSRTFRRVWSTWYTSEYTAFLDLFVKLPHPASCSFVSSVSSISSALRNVGGITHNDGSHH